MRLYACCGLLLCPLYPQHFAHGYVDKITWLPRPCRHVNRAGPDASVSLSPASSPGHVSSFLLHALRLFGAAPAYAVARLRCGAGLMEAACERRIPMPNWCSDRCTFLVNRHRSLRLNDWPAVQSLRFIAAPQMKVFSCFWPEVPDFCRPLKMCGLNHAPD